MESFLKLSKDNSDDSKKKSYINQAQHIWSMLDDMAASNPDSYKKFIEKTINEGKESMKSPEAHMCIKTSLTEPKKCNLFINVFSWNKIPEPESDEHPIPVFGKDIEYSNNVSTVNVAFNTDVLKKYGKNSNNPQETDMLINLTFNYIQSQNNVKINQIDYKILEANCYGDPKGCALKLSENNNNKTMSDLELAKEAINSIGAGDKILPDNIIKQLTNLGLDKSDNVSSTSQTEFSKNKPKNNKTLIQELDNESLELPSYQEKISIDKKDKTKSYFEVKVNLPKINSISECDLNIDKDSLILNANKLHYKELKISLKKLNENYEIQSNNVEAKFVKNKSLLRVKISLINKNN